MGNCKEDARMAFVSSSAKDLFHFILPSMTSLSTCRYFLERQAQTGVVLC